MMGGTAFEEAFPGLFTTAFHMAMRIVGDRNAAEDVAAEAMARTLDRWRRVSAMPSPTAWVVRVATNLAIDTLRERRPAPVVISVHSPEADATVTRLTVKQMLEDLPRRQRDVLVLRYLVDLSEAEIASVLRISRGSVKRHASRALHRLRHADSQGATSHAW